MDGSVRLAGGSGRPLKVRWMGGSGGRVDGGLNRREDELGGRVRWTKASAEILISSRQAARDTQSTPNT